MIYQRIRNLVFMFVDVSEFGGVGFFLSDCFSEEPFPQAKADMEMQSNKIKHSRHLQWFFSMFVTS